MIDAFIFDAARTPRGLGNPDGALHEVTALRISTLIINEILSRNGLGSVTLDDVIWGNVTQIGEQGGCLARAAVLQSQLDDKTPGVSINRFCASGLEAVNMAANQVMAGAGDAYLAGGVEMMSRVPMSSDGAALAADPSLAGGSNFVPQGISADLIATLHGYSRGDCDRYAVASQARAHRAWSEGRFDRSIVPVTDHNGLLILDHDEHRRPETCLETLAELEPAFAEIGKHRPGFDHVAIMKYPQLETIQHVHHAGNASGIVDGAAAVLIGSASFGDRTGLKPRARIKATARTGSEPTIMLTGPIPATDKALEQAGMSIGDVEIIEVNEAFAAVVLRFIEAFDLDIERVNPNGGAIAMGHPLGATGAMILGTALDELERVGRETALATLCVAGGMGAATIIERVDG